jgi:hypothetical protein
VGLGWIQGNALTKNGFEQPYFLKIPVRNVSLDPVTKFFNVLLKKRIAFF